MGPGHAELYTFCKISGRTLHFSLPLSAVISPVTRGLRMQTGVRSETGFREQRKRGTFWAINDHCMNTGNIFSYYSIFNVHIQAAFVALPGKKKSRESSFNISTLDKVVSLVGSLQSFGCRQWVAPSLLLSKRRPGDAAGSSSLGLGREVWSYPP